MATIPTTSDRGKCPILAGFSRALISYAEDQVDHLTKRLRDSLNAAVMEDVYCEFLAQIESEIGVTINQTALRQVVTGQNADNN